MPVIPFSHLQHTYHNPLADSLSRRNSEQKALLNKSVLNMKIQSSFHSPLSDLVLYLNTLNQITLLHLSCQTILSKEDH